MQSLALVILGAMGLVGAVFWFRSIRSTLQDPLIREKTWIALGLFDLLWVFFLGTSLIQAATLGLAAFDSSPEGNSPAAIAIGPIVSTFVCWLILVFVYPPSRSWFDRLGDNGALQFVAISLKRFFMIVPLVLLLHSLLVWLVPVDRLRYHHETFSQLDQASQWLNVFWLWVGSVVGASVWEEFVFRGVVLHWLVHASTRWKSQLDQVLLGRLSIPHGNRTATLEIAVKSDWGGVNWFAAVASALLFATAHIGQGLAPIPLFVFGLFLAGVAFKSQSLWPCIAIHGLFNAYNMFWYSILSEP